MSSLLFTFSPVFPSTYLKFHLFNELSKLPTEGHNQYPLNKCNNLHQINEHTSIRLVPSKTRRSLACAKNKLEEGTVPVMDLEELGEKDWSFLGIDSIKSKEDHYKKIDQIIRTGNVVDTSKILVSMGSEDFVDRLIEFSSSELLLVAHESFLALACIKEMHDKVKCWQGGFVDVPTKWAPFDVVFLYYLPAFSFELEEMFKALASRCAPGARVVISHLQGRQGLEQERQKYPDNVFSDLPNESALVQVATRHSFVVKGYIDDINFYLAVLEYQA